MHQIESMLVEARERLGATAEEAVYTLYRGAYFGERCQPLACTLQKYYHHYLGRPISVSTQAVSIVAHGGAVITYEPSDIDLAVMAAFDAGKLPFLESNRTGRRYRRRNHLQLERRFQRLFRRQQAWREVTALGEWQTLPDINFVTSELTPDDWVAVPERELVSV